MKNIILPILCLFALSAGAQTLKNGFVVNQTLGFQPLPIYSVNAVKVVSKDPDSSSFNVLRLIVDVTAEGNLCDAKSVALHIQYLGATPTGSKYRILLQSTKPLDVRDPVVACALNSRMVKLRLPLIVNGGLGSSPVELNYEIQTESPFGESKLVRIYTSHKGSEWDVRTQGLEASELP